MSMRNWSIVLSLVMLACCGNAYAQAAPKDASSSDSKANPFGLLGAGDLVQAAADLRKAAEAFERFGDTLEGVSATIAGALVEVSEHHAKMSDAFDPFGFKTAFATIQEQNQTIQALHKVEIERLTKECQALNGKLRRLERKMKRLELNR